MPHCADKNDFAMVYAKEKNFWLRSFLSLSIAMGTGYKILMIIYVALGKFGDHP
ncbi:hypothetical protein [Bartonella sp. CB169]|uniref:hypothetical protein n=1 Tax=Bartonella sp. CB169 TaxID=3112257 RepID=UPI00300E6977